MAQNRSKSHTKRRRWRGTYTVEAAFLTGIILLLLQLLITTALTLHDRAAAYETAQLYLSRYAGETAEDPAARKQLEAAFLQDARAMTVHEEISKAVLDRKGLRNRIRYEIGGEEKTVTASKEVRPLVLLRAVRGIMGREK